MCPYMMKGVFDPSRQDPDYSLGLALVVTQLVAMIVASIVR